MPDTRPKGSQWSLTKPSFKAEDIKHFANLHSNNPIVIYITFAICDDDTGNPFLQAFIKTSHRIRVSTMYRLIGPGIFSICNCYFDILVDIQMNSSFKEAGVDIKSQIIRSQIASLREGVTAGKTIYQLMEDFPDTCAKYPSLLRKYINKATAPPAQKNPEDKWTEDEWGKAGSPTGLPWKVYLAWKKGERYEPTEFEWATRKSAFTLKGAGAPCKCLSRKIYSAWMNGGEIYVQT